MIGAGNSRHLYYHRYGQSPPAELLLREVPTQQSPPSHGIYVDMAYCEPVARWLACCVLLRSLIVEDFRYELCTMMS